MGRFDLLDHAALLQWDGPAHVGLAHADIERLAPDIDLFVNLSGRFHLHSVLAAVRRRLYVDLDPGFTRGSATAPRPTSPPGGR